MANRRTSACQPPPGSSVMAMAEAACQLPRASMLPVRPTASPAFSRQPLHSCTWSEGCFKPLAAPFTCECGECRAVSAQPAGCRELCKPRPWQGPRSVAGEMKQMTAPSRAEREFDSLGNRNEHERAGCQVPFPHAPDCEPYSDGATGGQHQWGGHSFRLALLMLHEHIRKGAGGHQLGRVCTSLQKYIASAALPWPG